MYYWTILEAIQYHRTMLDDKPARNPNGDVDLFILNLLDGSVTVRGIARRTAARFPLQFGRTETALEQVQEITELYGRPAGESFESNKGSSVNNCGIADEPKGFLRIGICEVIYERILRNCKRRCYHDERPWNETGWATKRSTPCQTADGAAASAAKKKTDPPCRRPGGLWRLQDEPERR